MSNYMIFRSNLIIHRCFLFPSKKRHAFKLEWNILLNSHVAKMNKNHQSKVKKIIKYSWKKNDMNSW